MNRTDVTLLPDGVWTNHSLHECVNNRKFLLVPPILSVMQLKEMPYHYRDWDYVRRRDYIPLESSKLVSPIQSLQSRLLNKETNLNGSINSQTTGTDNSHPLRSDSKALTTLRLRQPLHKASTPSLPNLKSCLKRSDRPINQPWGEAASASSSEADSAL